MKIQEGPAFGAAIIGVGVAWLVNARYDDPFAAIGLGLLVAMADYFLLVWLQSFKKK